MNIGREATNDILLSQPEVSRTHLSLEQLPNQDGFSVRVVSKSQKAFLNGHNFHEATLPADRETAIESVGLIFRFIPENAQSQETQVIDISNFRSQFSSGSSSTPRFTRCRRRTLTATAAALMIAGGVVLWKSSSGRTQSEAEIIQTVRDGIFEFVYPKDEDAFVSYLTSLPVDKLPFKERNDKFKSIGTAFYVGNGRFLSAAHVFETDNAHLPRDYFVRDSKGLTTKVDQVLGLSNRLDIIIKARPNTNLDESSRTIAGT